MSVDPKALQINVMGREFRVACPESEQKGLLEAVDYLNKKMLEIRENGKVIGIRLLNIRPDTLLGKLGLQAGDMLKSINGFDMTSPEKALEAYAKLRTAPQIQIGIVRGGKPMNIEFNIK